MMPESNKLTYSEGEPDVEEHAGISNPQKN
jgi:hypothetical protein